MQNCEQTKGQTVLQHGESVRDHLFDLVNYLRDGSALKKTWNIPEWIFTDGKMLSSELLNDETLKLYTVYHDCGKPRCKTIDAEGKQHLYDHAKISYETFKEHFDDEDAAHLILHDMDLHTIKSEGVPQWFKENRKYVATLLLTAFSELHSNALMFGGIDSVSFKIKWKCLNQRAKQIITLIKSNK